MSEFILSLNSITSLESTKILWDSCGWLCFLQHISFISQESAFFLFWKCKGFFCRCQITVTVNQCKQACQCIDFCVYVLVDQAKFSTVWGRLCYDGGSEQVTWSVREWMSRLEITFNHCKSYLGSHQVFSAVNVARLNKVTDPPNAYSNYDPHHLLQVRNG